MCPFCFHLFAVNRGILFRSEKFDGIYPISTVGDVTTQIKPESFWLNVQHDAFYAQQNLSMSSFLISASRNVSIDYVSSPEVNFFKKIAGDFGPNGPSFVFQFLGKEEFEPTTNRTYGSILSNLTFVKTFASGILVPKSYILPLDDKQYLLPPTSLVQDAHKAGLQVYVSGFANDIDIAHDYSFDPVTEYLSFVDNGNFSVDGVLSDFPITASSSIGKQNLFKWFIYVLETLLEILKSIIFFSYLLKNVSRTLAKTLQNRVVRVITLHISFLTSRKKKPIYS